MRSARPVETLLWPLPPKDYNRFAHWLHVISPSGKAGNTGKLFEALRPHLKGAGHILAETTWDQVAQSAFGQTKNPAATLHKQCNALLEALIGFFAFQHTQREPLLMYSLALRYTEDMRIAAPFETIYPRAQKQIASLKPAEDLQLQLAVLQTKDIHSRHHSSSALPESAPIRDTYAQLLIQHFYQKTYYHALQYRTRQQLETGALAEMVSLLDAGFPPNFKKSADLSLFEQAYLLTMGPKSSRPDPARVRLFAAELAHASDQLSTLSYQTMQVVLFNLYATLVSHHQSRFEYYEQMAEMIWASWHKEKSLLYVNSARTALVIIYTVILMTEDSAAWRHRGKVFFEASEALLDPTAFETVSCYFQCIEAFVDKRFMACIEAERPKDTHDIFQVDIRFIQLQALYELEVNDRPFGPKRLADQIRAYLQDRIEKLPAQKVSLYKGRLEFIQRLFRAKRKEEVVKLHQDFEAKQYKYPAAFRKWLSDKLRDGV